MTVISAVDGRKKVWNEKTSTWEDAELEYNEKLLNDVQNCLLDVNDKDGEMISELSNISKILTLRIQRIKHEIKQ